MIGITEKGDAGIHTGWKPWVSEGKPAILITKSPSKLYQRLFTDAGVWKNKDAYELNKVIVHCTITGFGGTILEPGVKPWQEEMESAKLILKELGPERTVLRVDPIIPTTKGLILASDVIAAGRDAGFTRIRISFFDNYKHVQQRFQDAGIPQVPWSSFHAPLWLREQSLKTLSEIAGFSLEVCGEPGLTCTGCISQRDLNALGLTPTTTEKGKQRPTCACLAMKKELLSNKGQCKFGCLFCYWT